MIDEDWEWLNDTGRNLCMMVGAGPQLFREVQKHYGPM